MTDAEAPRWHCIACGASGDGDRSKELCDCPGGRPPAGQSTD